MSFLAWMFALGGLAIAFPILFHLIRPTPKGSHRFSTLMFLKESPPRISKRNRIDHWLLLLTRALIVLLLAAAFMRPFVRTGGEIFVNDLPGNRVALLIDRSASMQRGELWEQVDRAVDRALQDLEPGDDVALFAFDREWETVVAFSQDRMVDLESRKRLVRDQFQTLQPTWYHTDLGNALAATADMVSELEESVRSETGLQIVLISDMQQGAELGDLQTYVWPEDVRVRIHTVSLDAASNATARVLPNDSTTTTLDRGRRVRLVNAADSDTETFQVVWEDARGQQDSNSETSFYVPPGTSQLLRVPGSQAFSAERLVLRGDQCEFDNQFFVTQQAPRRIAIAWIGSEDPDDADASLFFLNRVLPESQAQEIQVQSYSAQEVVPWRNDRTPRLVVVSEPVSPEVEKQLREYVESGGLLLAQIVDRETLGSLGQIFPTASLIDEPAAKRDGYVMLGSIDFRHPLFAPLSSPRFNDFTNIRFWNHLPLTIDNSRETNQVVATFDDDGVALWQQRLGQGMALGLASSWRPVDSQLALSTKFVPLMTRLLGMADRTQTVTESYLVGETLKLPATQQAWEIRGPGDFSDSLSADSTPEFQFPEPGIYGFASGEQDFRVAVNLHASESQTAPTDSASLESFDVRIGSQPSRAELAGSLKKLKDTQLESRQRIWKWLLVGAICLLILETLMAGQRQATTATSEAVAS